MRRDRVVALLSCLAGLIGREPAACDTQLPLGHVRGTAQLAQMRAEGLTRWATLVVKGMPFCVAVALFGIVPGRIAGGVRRDDAGRIGDQLGTDQIVVVGEVRDIEVTGVEQPEAFVRHLGDHAVRARQVPESSPAALVPAASHTPKRMDTSSPVRQPRDGSTWHRTTCITSQQS